MHAFAQIWSSTVKGALTFSAASPIERCWFPRTSRKRAKARKQSKRVRPIDGRPILVAYEPGRLKFLICLRNPRLRVPGPIASIDDMANVGELNERRQGVIRLDGRVVVEAAQIGHRVLGTCGVEPEAAPHRGDTAREDWNCAAIVRDDNRDVWVPFQRSAENQVGHSASSVKRKLKHWPRIAHGALLPARR